jgi:acid stress chaperone HdeB
MKNCGIKLRVVSVASRRLFASTSYAAIFLKQYSIFLFQLTRCFMKKSIAIVAMLVSALAFSSTVFAKKEQALKYDMKELSCKELIEMDEETMGLMLMWLDGYLSGVTGDTKFDSDQFGSFAGSLGEYCAKNPTEKVVDASHKLGIAK